MRRQWHYKEAAGKAGSLFFYDFHKLLELPMRPFFLIAVTALALAACRNDAQDDSGRNAGAGLTADKIVANDITAIDAVTADAANMAADIDYADALANLSNDSGDANAARANRSGGTAKPARRSGSPTTPPATAPESPAETATNAQ